MKFCSHCGAQIDDNAVICVKCGCAVAPMSPNKANDEPYDGSCILAMIGSFLIPLLGLILFVCWKNTAPIRAKRAGLAALVGMVLSLISSVVVFLVCLPAIL